MATYSDKGEKKSIGDCILTAVSDFGEDLLIADEIEAINLNEITEELNLPIVFFLINKSIDRVLSSVREHYPHIPVHLKEYKRTQKIKKD